jgi:uncharacterized membrane protein YfcA
VSAFGQKRADQVPDPNSQTAAGFDLVIAVPGTLGFVVGGWGIPLLPAFSLGYVNWLGFLLIVPATLITVPLGSKLLLLGQKHRGHASIRPISTHAR